MALTRVSPGVYRDERGNLVQSTDGRSPTPTTQQRQRVQQQAGVVPSNTRLKTPADLINVGSKVAGANVSAGQALNNPNISGPFSGQTYDPKTGQITRTLSEGQQGVVSGLEGSSTRAGDVLQGLLGGQGALSSLTGNAGTGPGGYEDAVFKQLTRGLDTQKAQAKQDFDQELSNRGIPVGSDAYNQARQQFDTDWNDRFDTARQRAVTDSTNLGLSAMGQLSGVQQGGMMDHSTGWSPFQGTAYQGPNVNDVYNNITQRRLGKGQLAVSRAALRAKGAAGGGGGGSSASNSAFSASPPPGA